MSEICMHVLQVTPYDVFPPIDGGSNRSHGLVSTFPDAGDEVVRFCQRGIASRVYKLYHNGKQFRSQRLSRAVSVADGYTEIRSQSPVDDLVSVPGLFGYPQILLGMSIRLHVPKRLEQLLSWADVVMVERPWQFAAIHQHCENVPMIYSSHDVVTELYSDVRTKAFGTKVYDRMRALERIAVESADVVVCTSNRDKALLEEAYSSRGPILVAPNAIKRAAIQSNECTDEANESCRKALSIPPEAKVGLFVGGQHGPNIDAVDRLIDMAETFDRGENNIHFVIVGSAGDTLESTPSNVSVTGYVEEIDPYFDIADFGLNPIEWGGGTNIKMLDYFARGLPVVSTEFGTRGFDLTPGENVVVRPISEFADGIRLLAQRPNLRQEIGEGAREFVHKEHVWQEVSRSLRDDLDEVLNTGVSSE